jgi:hypothetical protein
MQRFTRKIFIETNDTDLKYIMSINIEFLNSKINDILAWIILIGWQWIWDAARCLLFLVTEHVLLELLSGGKPGAPTLFEGALVNAGGASLVFFQVPLERSQIFNVLPTPVAQVARIVVMESLVKNDVGFTFAAVRTSGKVTVEQALLQMRLRVALQSIKASHHLVARFARELVDFVRGRVLFERGRRRQALLALFHQALELSGRLRLVP